MNCGAARCMTTEAHQTLIKFALILDVAGITSETEKMQKASSTFRKVPLKRKKYVVYQLQGNIRGDISCGNVRVQLREKEMKKMKNKINAYVKVHVHRMSTSSSSTAPRSMNRVIRLLARPSSRLRCGSGLSPLEDAQLLPPANAACFSHNI